MKSRIFGFILGVVLAVVLGSGYCAIAVEKSDQVPEYLQQISVTIKAGSAQGSGTLFVRKIGDDNVAFVWTAGHVVAHLRNVRQIITPDGSTKMLVEFKDAQIVQELYQNGRRVGENKLDCKVIKYSDADYGEDLALLMVRRVNVYGLNNSAKFPTDHNYIPKIGIEVSHCGSLLGQFGANSYTTGVLSQIGRLLDGKGVSSKVFDQVTAVSFPGSSGGGMYEKSTGVYIGMLTQGVTSSQGFNFIVPVRRLYKWSETAKVTWAYDPAVQCPSIAKIESTAIEDEGTVKSSKAAQEEACGIYGFFLNLVK